MDKKLQGQLSFVIILVIFIGILSLFSFFPILSTVFSVSGKKVTDIIPITLFFSSLVGYAKSDCLKESSLIFSIDNFKFIIFHYNKTSRFVDKVYLITLDEEKLKEDSKDVRNLVEAYLVDSSKCEEKEYRINGVNIYFVYCNDLDFINSGLYKVYNNNDLKKYYSRLPFLVASNLTGFRNLFYLEDFLNIKDKYFNNLDYYDKKKIYIIYSMSNNNNYTLYASFCKNYKVKGFLRKFKLKKLDYIVGLILFPMFS